MICYTCGNEGMLLYSIDSVPSMLRLVIDEGPFGKPMQLTTVKLGNGELRTGWLGRCIMCNIDGKFKHSGPNQSTIDSPVPDARH